MLSQTLLPAPPPLPDQTGKSITRQLVEANEAASAAMSNLAQLEIKRTDANMRMDATPSGSSRYGVYAAERSALDAQIAVERASLTELRVRIAELQEVQAGNIEYVGATVHPSEQIFGLNRGEAITAATFLIFFPIAIAILVKALRRSPRTAAAPVEDDRIARIERAVEAVAIEVERIGESQRFQTKLMSEQSIDRPHVEVRR